MDFRPLSERPQLPKAEIISAEPSHSVSYSEKALDHEYNQDAVLNLEFSIVLENGLKLELSVCGVFDTAGGMVARGLSPKHYGSNIAVAFIKNRIKKYLQILSDSPDIKNFSERLSGCFKQILADIHREITNQTGIETCGCISATVVCGDEKYAAVANCGDTRNYFFIPGTTVSPQVHTLDHSNWLYREAGKILKAFSERFPDEYARIEKEGKLGKLQSIVIERLTRYQVNAYSNSMIDEVTDKPKKEYTLFINTDLSEGPGKHPNAVFRYEINHRDYLKNSNIVNSTLGSTLGEPLISSYYSSASVRMIVLSCTDGVYEILPIERIIQVINMEYKEGDPLALSRISAILKAEVKKQILKNLENKAGLFSKEFDDFGFTLQEF